VKRGKIHKFDFGEFAPSVAARKAKRVPQHTTCQCRLTFNSQHSFCRLSD